MWKNKICHDRDHKKKGDESKPKTALFNQKFHTYTSIFMLAQAVYERKENP